MKTYLHFEGRQYGVDGITPYTHVVMLALNKDPFRPIEPSVEELAAMSKEDSEMARSLYQANQRAFARGETSGKFALKPGIWVQGEEQANARAEEFRALVASDNVPKYSNVAVMPISGVIEHA